MLVALCSILAIMTCFCPEKYAVMADESVQSLLSGKIDYTLKYYLLYLKKIRLREKELSKGKIICVFTFDWFSYAADTRLVR